MTIRDKTKLFILRDHAIKHWQTMIDWAKTQPADDTAHMTSMYKAIATGWDFKGCPYCHEFLIIQDDHKCTDCPLTKNNISTRFCCGGVWTRVNSANTWSEWLVAAEEVLQYIKDHEVEG